MPRRPPATQRASESQDPSQHSEDDNDVGDTDRTGGSLEREARAIVRLALFTENRRTTLRRDDIVKKALSSGRSFNTALALANEHLQEIFGMKLVEVMSRTERDAADKPTNDDPGKKKAASTSKAYILRSTLHPAVIEAANTFDDATRVQDNNLIQVQKEDNEEIELESGGCLLAWQLSDRMGSIGLLAVILSLILVNGKELSDAQLKGYLKQLRLPPNAKVPFKTQAVDSLKITTVDSYLTIMTRQGFLDKTKKAVAAPSGSQGQNKNKRGRASNKEDDGNEAYTWKWGPRAFVEFGEDGIVEFLANFMVEKHELIEQATEEANADGAQGEYREKRRAEAAAMKTSILKAAAMTQAEE